MSICRALHFLRTKGKASLQIDKLLTCSDADGCLSDRAMGETGLFIGRLPVWVIKCSLMVS